MSNKTLAVISFILAFLFPIAGLILGIVTLVKIKNGVDKNGKGFAIAAIVISSLTMLMAIPLIIIGSVAYFGVVNPSSFLPDRCTLTSPVRCSDFAVTPSSISLILVNGAGRDMKISSADFTGDAVKGECKAAVDKEVATGAQVEVKATGCSIDSGEREKAWIDVEVDYLFVDSPTLEHTITGDIVTAIAK